MAARSRSGATHSEPAGETGQPPGRPSRRSTSRLVVGILLPLLVVVGTVAPEVGLLAWLERRLLYFPSQEIAHPFATFGPGAEEVRFGEHGRLHGVFVPAGQGSRGTTGADSPAAVSPHKARTIVYFHGNGGNLTHVAPIVARMRSELGANLFVFDYQGYGRSAGRPSEAATAADARDAAAYLRGRADVDPARIAYYGQSLGGAVAIALATETPPAGLVVQSSFTSIADLTRLHYPGLGFLLPLTTLRYDSLGAVGRVRAPLLILHGDADTLVPPDHGRRLFEAANEPKRLLILPGAGHNNIVDRGGDAYWQALREQPGFGTEAH